jgi:sortase A
MTTPSAPSPVPSRLEVQKAHRSSQRLKIAGRLGGALIVVGCLVLAFVLFEIFGTAYLQERHQSALRAQIDPTGISSLLPKAAHSTLPPVTVPTISPPGEGEPVAVIQIPKIGLNQVVVEGTGEDDLSKGPGHYTGTPLPGEEGNVGIAGHRTTWGRPFYNLDALVAGDKIVLATGRGTFVYRVTSSLVVQPSDVGVLKPTPTPTLTLTTCNPRFSASQRLVVHAALTSTITSLALRGAPGPVTYDTTKHPAGSSSSGTDLLGIIGWGALCVAIALGAWLASRRLRRRWLVLLPTVPAFAVALFFFFDALSSSLPAGY